MDRFVSERLKMARAQLESRGLNDPRLLEAFRRIPRHLFVPESQRAAAYDDAPQPIGYGQTISQPYIVGLMTSLAQLTGNERVLEVGTGSGYQAAVLSRLARHVHTVELVPELARRAAELLARLKCRNVIVHQADGSLGWPGAAPYAAILVTAAAPRVPPALLEQLGDGGRIVIPLDSQADYQILTVLRSEGGEFREQTVASVAFVPLRGRYGRNAS